MNIKKHLEMNQLDSSSVSHEGVLGAAGDPGAACPARTAQRRAAAGASRVPAPAHRSHPNAASGPRPWPGMGHTARVPARPRGPVGPILQECAGGSAQTGCAVGVRPPELTEKKTGHRREHWGTAEEEAQGKGPLLCESSPAAPGRPRWTSSHWQRGTSSGDVPNRNIKGKPQKRRSPAAVSWQQSACPAA